LDWIRRARLPLWLAPFASFWAPWSLGGLPGMPGDAHYPQLLDPVPAIPNFWWQPQRALDAGNTNPSPPELRCYPGTTGLYGNRTLRTDPTVHTESPSDATSTLLDRHAGVTSHCSGRAAASPLSKGVFAPMTKRADAADVHYRQSPWSKGNRSDRITASSR
jgi:hypothetical protein